MSRAPRSTAMAKPGSTRLSRRIVRPAAGSRSRPDRAVGDAAGAGRARQGRRALADDRPPARRGQPGAGAVCRSRSGGIAVAGARAVARHPGDEPDRRDRGGAQSGGAAPRRAADAARVAALSAAADLRDGGGRGKPQRRGSAGPPAVARRADIGRPAAGAARRRSGIKTGARLKGDACDSADTDGARPNALQPAIPEHRDPEDHATAMLSTLANPARFMRISGVALPWLGGASAVVLALGLVWSLVLAPPDYQQGESVRIMFIHVPAAWMALSVYLFVAIASAVALVWWHPLAEIAAQAAAPIGAAFTLICLATGSLWGRPMWGAWWVWDARLTSVLVLFFLYLGYIALVNAFDDASRGGRAGSLLALVGIVNLPIIKFSVDWWNTLHQPASVLRLGGPTIDVTMLAPLLVMALGFTLLFGWLLLVRMRTALNERRLRALRIYGDAGAGNASEASSGAARPAWR